MPPEQHEGFSELSLEVDDFNLVTKQITQGLSKITKIVNDRNFYNSDKAPDSQESHD